MFFRLEPEEIFSTQAPAWLRDKFRLNRTGAYAEQGRKFPGN
jgi:hypothetical protein